MPGLKSWTAHLVSFCEMILSNCSEVLELPAITGRRLRNERWRMASVPAWPLGSYELCLFLTKAFCLGFLLERNVNSLSSSDVHFFYPRESSFFFSTRPPCPFNPRVTDASCSASPATASCQRSASLGLWRRGGRVECRIAWRRKKEIITASENRKAYIFI